MMVGTCGIKVSATGELDISMKSVVQLWIAPGESKALLKTTGLRDSFLFLLK